MPACPEDAVNVGVDTQPAVSAAVRIGTIRSRIKRRDVIVILLA